MKRQNLGELNEPFVERTRRLFEELELAIRWDRPAILLAVYRSFFVVLEAENLLTLWLTELGQKTERYIVTPENADIPLHLSQRSPEERATTVFFIEDLSKGREESLRALNIRREYFVEYGLRAVFWLNEEEARQLALAAPDFWRFRHRVVEFPEVPAPERALQLIQSEIWAKADLERAQDTDAKIALREKLLAELPEDESTLAARGDLLLSLGELYAARYDAPSLERAEKCLDEAKSLFDRIGNAQKRGQALLSLARVRRYLGQLDEALRAIQEVVELYRGLASADPQAFLPDLTASLNNLGNILSQLGRYEEALHAAEEAVNIWRKLASETPQTFLPDLAGSLNNLGNMLSALGRREEALQAIREAVEIYRTLAQVDPQAFRLYLAASLYNLGRALAELGRPEEALQATQEAVEVYRVLARETPQALRPDLAASLNNLSVMLSTLGRREEAVQAAQEAVEIYRALAQANPQAFLPDLAKSLNNLGGRLSEVARQEQAFRFIQEAVEVYRRLAEFYPQAFLPDLARSLHTQGSVLRELGRDAEATAALAEALRLILPFLRAWPAAFAAPARTWLHDYLQACENAGQPPDPAVVEPLSEALQRLEAA